MDNLQITIDGKDITLAPEFDAKEKYKAERDTALNESSGIKGIVVTEDNIRALKNLGMIWGFLKYHHEAVCNGEYNMDAELFRVIPKVLAAKDNNEANVVLEKWVDGFGAHPACTQCDSTSGRAKLMPDYATLFAPGNLPASLQKKLAFIRDNRHKRDESYYVGMFSVGSPRFQHENSFAKTAYPDAGVRLLALYRYWNMILYFFPDRHLMGENWSEVLAAFIPAFCSANDARNYENTCIKLVGRIHDTHANVWGGGGYADGLKGKYYLPVEAKFIDGKMVVTEVFEQPGEKIFYKGDIIEQIDNEDVDSLVAKNLPLTPGSNIESQLRDLASVNGSLMRSYKNGISVSLLHNGQRKTTPVRLLPSASIREAMKSRKQPAYRMLPGNIGCIYPASLQESDFEKIKDTFRNTRGIVIDMRCYPNDFMTFTYGGWFKAQPSPFVLFTKGRVATPGRFDFSEPLENGDDSTEHYKGKLVILVNEQTQSSAEYQTMALQSTPGAKVVGSTTAGADGNVTPIKLPGGLMTMFSGIGILYPDSTETQRKGVRIDREVKPTIKGIKEGRDEVLDEALRMLKS
ncbi:MAG: hypothetical protein KF744_02400 [Taibaiella sp.]|nr:hypothetical protein [Taibaiella sp.]